MGSLAVPASGLVYVDANIVIYTIETHPTYAPVIAPLWTAAYSGSIAVVSSELLLMETLVRPIRMGDTALQTLYERAMRGPDRRLLPITLDILREAARIRAAVPAIRTPDALHAATALLNACTLFLTNNNDYKHIPGLTVAVLDDILAAP